MEGQWNTTNKALDFRTVLAMDFKRCFEGLVFCVHFGISLAYVRLCGKTHQNERLTLRKHMLEYGWPILGLHTVQVLRVSSKIIWKTYTKSLKPLSTRMLYLHAYSCTKTEPIPLSCLDSPRSEDEHEDRLVGEKNGEALILQQVT